MSVTQLNHYLDNVDHKVAEMFRNDYRTLLYGTEIQSNTVDGNGLVAHFLCAITFADNYTILELTDQYIAPWLGDFDPDNFEV